MSVKQTNKHVIPIVTLIGLISLIYVEVTSAYLSEVVTTTGNKIISGCWDNPSAPVLSNPKTEYITNESNISFGWEESASSCPTAIISYKLTIYTNEQLSDKHYSSDYSGNTSHTKELTEGKYWWVVTVQDQYFNTTTSQVRKITIDQSAPETSLGITENNKTYAITNAVNPSNWITTGDVEIQDGNPIRVGNNVYDNDLGNYLWENKLMQSITAGTKTLSFDYKFQTSDDAFSDLPGFRVIVNGSTILKIDAKSGNTDWTTYYWDLAPHDQSKNINIEFQAGNTGDKINQSWVYLKNISTDIIRTIPNAVFTIEASDALSGISSYEYSTDGATFTKAQQFSLTENTYTVYYRATDIAGNVSNSANATIVIVQEITDSPDTATITTYEDKIGYQNIIINELLWRGPGSLQSIELKNTTNQDINLSGAYLTKFDGNSEVNMNIDLSSKTISAGGYLVIETDGEV